MGSIKDRNLRVFLCHASDDKPIVRELYKKLLKEGIDVWFDEESLMPGQDWELEIPEAVNNADSIIVCLSNKSINKAGYIQKEIRFALDAAEKRSERDIFIIPVKLESCDVPQRFNRWQWVDLFYQKMDFDTKGYHKLLTSLIFKANTTGAIKPKYDRHIITEEFDMDKLNPFLKKEFELRRPTPLLIVISGPSGVGKDSVVQRMIERGFPFHFVVTATTREKREKEVHGKDYWFVSKDEFSRLIQENQLIEYAIVYGDYKGIPKSEVRGALASGQDVIMRVDVQGAETVRKLAPEALLIFITCEDENELERRLRQRKTETADSLSLRIATARKELQRIEAFDYVIVNQDFHLDDTVNKVRAIISAEHLRVKQRKVTL